MTNNNTPEEVINKIKSQLTGNREEDRQIILDSMHQCDPDDENTQEIVHELSRMLVDYLTPEEIERFNTALRKDLPELALIESVEDDLNNQHFDDAFRKLESYMNDDTRRFINDDKIEYHVFDNEFEERLFEEYGNVDREVRMIPFEVPIFKLYYYYAFLLVEQNRLNDAEEYLKKGLEYNPVSPKLLFELIDLYKKTCEWTVMNKYLQRVYECAYSPELLARYYRDLGYYYTEIGKLDIAVALYIHSLKYDQTGQAYNELDYLKYNGQNIEIEIDEVCKLLQSNDIPLVASDFIVKEYRLCGDRFAEDENLEAALEMYAYAYALDDSLENQMRYKMAEAALNGDDKVNINL